MCFSLFCRLMRRENGLYLSPMMRHLQKSNTVLISTHNQQRREQRVGLKWLPDERQEFSNVPTRSYDQLWIYSFFHSSFTLLLLVTLAFHLGGELVITAAQ